MPEWIPIPSEDEFSYFQQFAGDSYPAYRLVHHDILRQTVEVIRVTDEGETSLGAWSRFELENTQMFAPLEYRDRIRRSIDGMDEKPSFVWIPPQH